MQYVGLTLLYHNDTHVCDIKISYLGRESFNITVAEAGNYIF